MTHFESRDFIEDMLKNIDDMWVNENKINRAKYNLFHLEECRRQFFWSKSFNNLAFVSKNGEVYLLTPAYGDAYSLFHCIFSEEFGYMECSPVSTGIAGGECFYLNGINEEFPSCDEGPFNSLEENIDEFETITSKISQDDSLAEYNEHVVASLDWLVRTLNFSNDSTDWDFIVTDKKILAAIKAIKALKD